MSQIPPTTDHMTDTDTATAHTWIVLGASSSIARAFAQQVASEGHALILAGRDTPDLDIAAADLRIRHGATVAVVPFDALALEDIPAFVERCTVLAPGGLSLFVAFATMPAQSELDQSAAALDRMIRANVTGVAAVLNAFAPVLETQGHGHVVAIGSVAGDRGRLKNYNYGATKAALHTYLQGLRARLCRHGVTVLTVKPGFTDTAMSFGNPGMFLVASPQALATAILHAVARGTLVLYYPRFWQLIMLIIRHIPERIFQRLNI